MMSFLGVYVENLALSPERSPTPNPFYEHALDHRPNNRSLPQHEQSLMHALLEELEQKPCIHPETKTDSLPARKPAITIRISPKTKTCDSNRKAVVAGALPWNSSTADHHQLHAGPSSSACNRHLASQDASQPHFDPQPSIVGSKSEPLLTSTRLGSASSLLDGPSGGSIRAPPTVWYGNRPPPKPWMRRTLPSKSMSSVIRPSRLSQSISESIPIVKEEEAGADGSLNMESSVTKKSPSPSSNLVPTQKKVREIIDLSSDDDDSSQDEVVIVKQSLPQTHSKTVTSAFKGKLKEEPPVHRSPEQSISSGSRPRDSTNFTNDEKSPIRIKIRSKHVKRRVPIDDNDDADVDLDALLALLPTMTPHKKPRPPQLSSSSPAKSRPLATSSSSPHGLQSPAKIKTGSSGSSLHRAVEDAGAAHSHKAKTKASQSPVTPSRRSQRDAVPSAKRMDIWNDMIDASKRANSGSKTQKIGDMVPGVLNVTPHALCKATAVPSSAVDVLRAQVSAPQSSQAAKMAVAAIKRKMKSVNASDDDTENDDDDIVITSSPPKKIKTSPIVENSKALASPSGNISNLAMPSASNNNPTPAQLPSTYATQVPVFSFPDINPLANTADATPFRPHTSHDFFLSPDADHAMQMDSAPVAAPQSQIDPSLHWETPSFDLITSPSSEIYPGTPSHHSSFGSVSTTTSCSSSASELVTPVGSPLTLFESDGLKDGIGKHRVVDMDEAGTEMNKVLEFLAIP